MGLRTLVFGLWAGLVALNGFAQTPVQLDGYAEWSRGDHLVVDGQRVRWNGTTRLKLNGVSTPAAVPIGSEVKVKGVRQPDGSVLASELEAKRNGTAMFEAAATQGGAQLEAFMVQKGAMLQPGANGALSFVGRLQQSGPMVDRLQVILRRVAPPHVNAAAMRLYVVETADWNAMVLPNGAVVVFSGLAESMSDDEMAVILGHELAHYTHEHSRRQMKRAMWGQVAGAVADAALSKMSNEAAQYGLAVAAALTLSAVQNGYGRDLEDQADRVGLRYAHEAGYDVNCGPRLWRRFGEKYGDTDRVTNFFMGDHSLSAARVQNLQAELRYNYAGRPPAVRAATVGAEAQESALVSPVARPEDRGPTSVEGYSMEQVRALWGAPSLTQSDPDGGVTWYYDSRNPPARVQFRNNRASGRQPEPRDSTPNSLEGYSMDQVRALLGPPSLTQSDADGVTTWYYDTPTGTKRVYFMNNRASLQRRR